MKKIEEQVEQIIEIDAWKEGVSFKDTENAILDLIKQERKQERERIREALNNNDYYDNDNEFLVGLFEREELEDKE